MNAKGPADAGPWMIAAIDARRVQTDSCDAHSVLLFARVVIPKPLRTFGRHALVPRQPAVDFGLCIFLGLAVVLLDLSSEFLAASLDDVEIVIGELALLLLGLALELFPATFNLIPVHGGLLFD